MSQGDRYGLFKDQADLDVYMAKFNKDVKPFHPETMDESDEELEGDLQRKCEGWLKRTGYPYLHDRSRKKNPPGMFLDLHIYLPKGRHVVIELKIKNRKLNEDQKKTYQKIMFLGHEIYKVQSYKRFLEIMR
jgi:hypothetical protein